MAWLRLGHVLLRRRQGRVDPVVGAAVTFRCWPNDIDLNRHMNNARFLSMMDLGRYDLTRRIGLLAACRRNKWYPVVASATIRFRRSIPFLARFTLHTRVVCWDDRRFFLEQRFERDGVDVATAYVRAVFLGPEGAVPTAKVLGAIGEARASPPFPDALLRWVESETA